MINFNFTKNPFAIKKDSNNKSFNTDPNKLGRRTIEEIRNEMSSLNHKENTKNEELKDVPVKDIQQDFRKKMSDYRRIGNLK